MHSDWRPKSLKDVFSRKNAARFPGLMRQTYGLMIFIIFWDIFYLITGAEKEYAVLLTITAGVYAALLVLAYLPVLGKDDSPQKTILGLRLTQNQFIFLLPFTYVLVRIIIPAILA